MTVSSSLLAAVLTVGSVLSLSLLSLMCLRCKRKSKIIHEERQIYNPQTFQRGGSKFAVMQSKPVTRPNQITTSSEQKNVSHIEAQEEFHFHQIVSSSPDDNYIAPIPVSVYENEDCPEANPAVYGNIFTSLPITEDEDDYENSKFLNEVMKEEDNEPDYVNQGVDCT